ncbi:MAG: sigma-54 dependent transcriptional regulator [Planctomycetes bacterium]|nr:sigma-54 dependent transcriptional regulator [Planctomycetota bacterium]
MKVCRILFLEQSEEIAKSVAAHLRLLGHEVVVASDVLRCMKIFASEEFDILLLDLTRIRTGRVNFVRELRSISAVGAIIVWTDKLSIVDRGSLRETGIREMLTLPVDLDQVELAIERSATDIRKTDQIFALSKALQNTSAGGRDTLGTSEAWLSAMRAADRLVEQNSPVLIAGEIGTGREHVARMIHVSSSRADFPFVHIDCVKLPCQLLETEILGMDRMNGLGESGRVIGAFEQAHFGTLFIQEVTEFTDELQRKLLKVIDEGRFSRFGSSFQREVDVRVIVSTSRNLGALADLGQFHKELYDRLSRNEIKLPPLREREGDVDALASYFLLRYAEIERKHISRILPGARELLRSYSWPENVRELKKTIHRAVLIAESDAIEPRHLPQHIRGRDTDKLLRLLAAEAGATDSARGMLEFDRVDDIPSLHDVEFELIRKARAICSGNNSLVAKKLGIGRSTLYRKLAKFGSG